MKMSVVDEATVAGAEDGDILSPLKRIHEKYLRHGARLLEKAEKQDRKLTEKEELGVLYYGHAAETVMALVLQ